MTDWKAQARLLISQNGGLPADKYSKFLDDITAALERAAAQERERCAMIAHGYPMVAAAIRNAP